MQVAADERSKALAHAPARAIAALGREAGNMGIHRWRGKQLASPRNRPALLQAVSYSPASRRGVKGYFADIGTGRSPCVKKANGVLQSNISHPDIQYQQSIYF